MVALTPMQVTLGDRLALRGGSAPRRSLSRRVSRAVVKPAAAAMLRLPSKEEVAKVRSCKLLR